MRLVWIVLFGLLCIGGSEAFQITEVYPDTYLKGDADEYLVISGSGSLTSLEITDGEGTIRFPAGASSSGSLTIAREGDAFTSVTGKVPDYELIDRTPSVPEPIVTGKFQLANQKDELRLITGGQVIQNITWPGTFKPRKGQIHTLNPDGRWDVRVFISGASRFEPAVFNNISGTAFVSPDCSRAVFEQTLLTASEEILVNIYEFTDPDFADLLCAAAGRGVHVSVLVEGGPVGGISPEEQAVIARLRGSGIAVSAMTGVGEDHAPYRYNHAKYLVIDKKRVLLTTENFKSHSFPKTGESGNRGWGVILESSDIAGYFSRVFMSDLDGPGIMPIQGSAAEIPPYSAAPYTPVFSPVSFTAASVIPVLAPDTTGQIVPLLDVAQERILIEQAYIKHWSDGKRNPYLEAAINAARRGVEVRIILDSFYYNTEDEEDNDEIVAEINAIGDREHIPLEARLIDLGSSGLLKLHAKGVVADDSIFISSINWNENSPVFNREAGFIIKDRELAGYFSSVFESDWKGGRSDQGMVPKGQDNRKIALAIGVIIFLVGLYSWRRIRR